MYRLLFPNLNGIWQEINLNEEAKSLLNINPNPANDPVKCKDWVKSLHQNYKCDYSYGGLYEDRSILWRGHYHKPEHTVHLGIDYNVQKGTKVFIPFDGKLILAEGDPDQNGGWGHRLIFKVKDFYVIFAHLGEFYSNEFVLDVGDEVKKGTYIGYVGGSSKNGGWFPHLHVQCMREYDRNADGYCKYYDNMKIDFPDPNYLLEE